jgi:hypothetical protein
VTEVQLYSKTEAGSVLLRSIGGMTDNLKINERSHVTYEVSWRDSPLSGAGAGVLPGATRGVGLRDEKTDPVFPQGHSA